ncbi:DNA methyltransferase [Flavobacterium sp.]|uniref:DNA methyltransferase n=1 Tax=Flavobacterium sp. TaxID=239 RepID=UPI0035B3F2D3
MFQDTTQNQPVTVLGKTFNSEKERRDYFREELRKQLPELKKMEGFPKGEDEDIINLSDPPFYTACPNPWLNNFIAKWEEEKKLTPINVKSPLSVDIEVDKNIASYNVHSYHTKVPHTAILRYLAYYTNPGDIILDAFGGTGMTGYAASMMEYEDAKIKLNIERELNLDKDSINWGVRHSIVSDLSPYATFISSIFNSSFDSETFFVNSEKVVEKLKQKMKFIFHSSSESINYIAYTDFILCRSCGEEQSFYEVSYNDDFSLKNQIKCLHCSSIIDKKKLEKSYEHIYDEITKTTRIVRKFRPILVNQNSNNGRKLRNWNENDQSSIDSIKISVIKIKEHKILDKGINWGDTWRAGVHKGFEFLHDFYDKSIILFINEYLEEIENYENKNQLLFLLTAILPKLTKLNRYMPQHGSRALVGPMAGTLYLPSMYVVNNPIDQLEFQIKKIIKGIKSKKQQIVSTNSATKLSINDQSIDYIFTDPPFGANIMYSELNSFPEQWLKVSTDNTCEAIESKSQNKSLFEYQDLMLNSFNEYYRVLKDDKWMTVVFSNTSASVWNSIQYSINKAGFVISSVFALNKGKGGLQSLIGPTAVNQDLVISCYKPSIEFIDNFKNNENKVVAVWDFIYMHLSHLPLHLLKDKSTSSIIERSPKILFDRLIAFYVQKGLPVPIDAGKFQQGLRENFIERDGMFFTNEQVQVYDKKKQENPEFIQLSLLVSSEQDGVLWLKNYLYGNPMSYQDIQPQWMQALAGVRKGDVVPELAIILEENFLKDENGKWYVPNTENEIDLEKMRSKRLLKQFESYKTEVLKPKGKLKEVRVEALRAGFKECYQDKDFKTIVLIGDRIPNNLLMEDEVLLQFYDIASSRV